jgi:hypothetical protein
VLLFDTGFGLGTTAQLLPLAGIATGKFNHGFDQSSSPGVI